MTPVKWFVVQEGYGCIQPDDGSKDRPHHCIERAGLMSGLNDIGARFDKDPKTWRSRGRKRKSCSSGRAGDYRGVASGDTARKTPTWPPYRVISTDGQVTPRP